MTTLCLNRSSAFSQPSVSTGASDLARRLAEAALGVFADYARTARGQQLFAGPKDDLAASVVESNEMASIGEGVTPSAAALKEAHDLIDSLPESYPRPHIVIEPSGAIGFEWDFPRGRFAILALKGTGVLEGSYRFGPGDEWWGNTPFSGSLDIKTLHRLADLGAAR